MTMAATSSSVPDPPALPTSEQEFIQTLLSLRFRLRANYVQKLALTHGEALVPLIKQLLATEPAVKSIPIVRPAKNESELNADGGNPNPVVDVQPLRYPQTNSSSRYMQRDTGITMAITMANKESKGALEILLATLNHPNQIGKKRLIQCLSSCATDDEILHAAQDSAPAIRDALVAALTKKKRKALVNDLLGKPRKDVIMAELHLPLSTRFRKALEEAKEYEREKVWNEFAKALDLVNQPPKNLCEEGENIKDVVLHLQETLPPLFLWDAAYPEHRAPKLASLTEKYLVALLYYDAERTVRILQMTSWQAQGDGANKEKKYTAHIPTAVLDNKQARKFWCRRDVGSLLQEYWLSLVRVDHGVLVKTGALPYSSLFRCCRGPVVSRLIHAVLDLLDAEEFKVHVAAKAPERMTSIKCILNFAVAGILDLTTRIGGCSAIEDRNGGTVYFHGVLSELLVRLLATSISSIQVQTHVSAFDQQLYDTVLQPLLREHSPYSYLDIRKPGPLKKFPPLAQVVFDEVHSILKPKSRKDAPIMSVIEDFLNVLAPQDTSVYAIPDDKFKTPYSSIPAWNNSKVFQAGVINCLKKKGKGMVELDSNWISHFCALATYLTQSQRDEAVELITALPSFKLLINKSSGYTVFPMLQKLCTNLEVRHRIVAPLVFCDKKDREVNLGERISDWAAYVDIRIPSARAQLVKETVKPAFEDRLKWIGAIIKATWMSGEVKEWINTLKWLIPKIRNEIQPNLMTLSPFLLPDHNCVPRQYLDDATLEEAQQLSTLYLTMDSQNAAAVTPVAGISRFIDKVAGEALKRFAGRPEHPFFQLGIEIPWRRSLAQHGELTALENYSLAFYQPNYANEVSERREEAEITRRQTLAKEEEFKKKEGGPWGNYLIREGEEENFVQAIVKAYHLHWLSVKSVMDPEVDGEDVQAFKTARPNIFRSVCSMLHKILGWRWKSSPTLVSYLYELLEALAQAPTKTYGPDKVLCWNWDEGHKTLKDYKNYINDVGEAYTVGDWIREMRGSLPWYKRFRDLRLGSTDYNVEVHSRVSECVLKNGKRDQTRYEELMTELLNNSPSAIHLSSVREFVSTQRPDLLSDEQLSMTKEIVGVFNQVNAAEPWNLIVKVPSMLTPHQCELLKVRHLMGMTDSASPFNTRVEHAQAFVTIPTTTVEDIANVLCIPSLPSRIIEALLMFLPTMSEPACTLQLLLAPVYIQSHLARTSIHAVENALKCVPLNQIPDFILPLFPPVGERQQKVTVQKEGIRLACSSMRLVADARISGLIEELLLRPEQHLHNDVRVVILQSVLGLLTSPEAKEQRYRSKVEWMWKSLALTASSDVFKKSGVATVLLAVTATVRVQQNLPRVNTALLRRTQTTSATLNDLATVRIPEALINRYVEEVLIPMCAEPIGDYENDKDLIDIRNLALQVLIQNDGWVTTQNAPGLAKDWRKEAAKVPCDEDKHQHWRLFALGIAQCVGKEVEGAMEAGQEAVIAWDEMIALIKDEVHRFLDKTESRTLRKKALERIQSLNLGSNFLLQNFDKARDAGAFKGDERDLTKPLLDKAIESVTWTTAMLREISVFRPYDDMTQDRINQEALSILLLIADYSNRYLSAEHDVRSWVTQQLLSKFSKNNSLRRFIGHALLEPHEDLVDWIHLEYVALTVLSQNKGVFTLEEVGTYIERLAHQDNSTFYWTNRVQISDMLNAELDVLYVAHEKRLSTTLVSSVAKVLTPLMTRARTAGWTKGPDAAIVWDLVQRNMDLMCSAFPKDIGPLLHHKTVHGLEFCTPNSQLPVQISRFTMFGAQAMFLGREPKHAYGASYSLYGLSPAMTLILETCLSGKLGELDLTSFIATHSLPWEAEYGRLYNFQGSSTDDASVSHNATTLHEADARWHKLMSDYSAHFTPMEQAVEAATLKPVSPLLVDSYRSYANSLLSENPKFILNRPFVYLDYIRLALTAPGTTLTIESVASQLLGAFMPDKDPAGDEFAYTWAPPLGLALDLAEYLLNEVREEVATEGQREAQLIEKLSATFLTRWIKYVVTQPAGKHLADAEDVKALEARYLALVERLCEHGSGGQSLALQLSDFVPGGIQKIVETTAEDEVAESDYSDYSFDE
ncbi:hypothetical protein BGX28_010243 [Mortierella sp. GBA30]|nr:hypothetical protein BGX28_010243 [Mortierella sp. GBA30]